MTGKRNRKLEGDKDSRKVPTQRKQHTASPWTAKIKDELTICTADFSENKEDYNDSLDPAAHLVLQPPPSDHNPDTVSVSIVTGEEEEMSAISSICTSGPTTFEKYQWC